MSNSSDMKIFCDMDGVLDDFVTAACAAHGRPIPYTDPANLGCFDIEKIWGITPEEFWTPLRGYDFWMNLQKTPEADYIITTLSNTYGEENVALLTAPSEDGDCIRAKRDWVKAYYPSFAKRMIFTSAKEFLAGRNRLLVDDRDRNLDDFTAAGGLIVPVPRPWNQYHRKQPLDFIRHMYCGSCFTASS